MANVDRVCGFRPVNAAIPEQYLKRCYKAHIAVSGLFVGDLVTLAGSASSDGYPTVTVITAGDAGAITGQTVARVMYGVVVGVDPQPSHTDRTYLAIADTGYLTVCIDPNVILEVQADGAIPVTSVGLNAVMIQTSAGSTTTGASGQELDSGTTTAPATTYSYQLKIIGFPDRADNEINATNNRVLVVPVAHSLKGYSVGV